MGTGRSATVAEIAQRAGLTKSTLFQHFTDKREVLVVGQDTLYRLLADEIASVPGGPAAYGGYPPAGQATRISARRAAWVPSSCPGWRKSGAALVDLKMCRPIGLSPY